MPGITGDITPFFILYGLAMLLGMGVIVYLVGQYGRFIKMAVDKEAVYNSTEITALDEFLKRTKPLIWEHAKLLEAQSKRSFRRKLEESLVNDFFKEREEQKKKN